MCIRDRLQGGLAQARHALAAAGGLGQLRLRCPGRNQLDVYKRQEPYRAATQDSESAAQFRSLTDYSDGMTELLNSYPDVTSSLPVSYTHLAPSVGVLVSHVTTPFLPLQPAIPPT